METLEMLAQNEEKIGQLYKIFASNHKEYKEIWEELCSDEKEHAAWIRKFIPQVKSGQVTLESRRFSIEAIASYQSYLDDEIKKAKKKEQPLMTALTITLYIEKSLMEHRFYDIVKGDPVELHRLLTQLEEATISHLARVQKTWSTSRF